MRSQDLHHPRRPNHPQRHAYLCRPAERLLQSGRGLQGGDAAGEGWEGRLHDVSPLLESELVSCDLEIDLNQEPGVCGFRLRVHGCILQVYVLSETSSQNIRGDDNRVDAAGVALRHHRLLSDHTAQL